MRSATGQVIKSHGRCPRGGIADLDVLKARSSTEAELYALTRCSTPVLGTIQMRDFKIELTGVVRTGPCASVEIVSRVGVSWTRHIHVHHLWFQQKLFGNDLKAVKGDDKFNVSHIMTKYLKRYDLDRILHMLGMYLRAHRCCVASIRRTERDEGEGVDLWIGTQNVQRFASDIDKPSVERMWQEMRIERDDQLQKEVFAHSRWLRQHALLRLALLNHAPGLHLKMSISLEGALKVGLLSCVRSLTLSCCVCFACSLGRLRSEILQPRTGRVTKNTVC